MNLYLDASALLGEPVTLATFDQQLWQAAQEAAVAAWPEGLSRPNRG